MYLVGSAGIIAGVLRNRVVILGVGLVAGILICAGVGTVEDMAKGVIDAAVRIAQFIAGAEV